VPDVVSFGPFELDTRTGDLRKRGRRIRLAPQPASLLTLLATRPGQLVTRDEIRLHLWGGGVVVEYERSLNACLAHLRATLGDHADAPRYIETSPRRGYRFIAPVQRWRPFPQPTVAVLPFVNLTSDPAFEYFVTGLTAALITELASISALRVISHQSVLHLKGSSRTLPEIAAELGADALIEGSAVCEADRVRLDVQLVAASPERHLWAKAYECATGEVIVFHRQVARAVADTVDAALTPGELDRLSQVPRIDPLAQRHISGGVITRRCGPRSSVPQPLASSRRPLPAMPATRQRTLLSPGPCSCSRTGATCRCSRHSPAPRRPPPLRWRTTRALPAPTR
jgi:TolB-like protein/DNA-binding winged helix-turn-helix (wHTH) protein